VGRRTFCGPACVDAWRIKTDPAHLRRMVWERDHGVCALCGLDTCADMRQKRCGATGDRWQADHIVPVIEGGGECGLDNLRTLCTACHKRATAALAARRADQRVAELRQLVDGPLEFGNLVHIEAKRKLRRVKTNEESLVPPAPGERPPIA
jgi:5-methylcytosine-specific restriction protein A